MKSYSKIYIKTVYVGSTIFGTAISLSGFGTLTMFNVVLVKGGGGANLTEQNPKEYELF